MMRNLTVPSLMVAGVAAIGIFAAYRLVKLKQDVSPEGSDGNLALLGDPLTLRQGAIYRGRLRVREAGAPPFLVGSDRATLENALKLLGFGNVRVFMREGELPANWPVSTTENAGSLTRWFQGEWRMPSATVPRPPDVEAIWMAGGSAVAGMMPFDESLMVHDENEEAVG